jgi:hypothetical protein
VTDCDQASQAIENHVNNLSNRMLAQALLIQGQAREKQEVGK